MSTGGGRQEENDCERSENPLAVWLRNVPVWLTEERRFYHEIQSWPDCDPSNSHWFKNKQDNTWVGVRYGWAIVSFHSEQGRNAFLEDENRHFVRESKDDVWERLKVSPWFDKRRAVGRVERLERSPVRLEQRNPRPVPLYKADLTRDQGQYEWEDFCRSCTDNSTASYKGRIHSYLSSSSSLGLLEVKLLLPHGAQTELILFHTDSVWQGKAETLRPGTQVSFNARRLPAGLITGRRFQAKTVWVGEGPQPNAITAPSASKLDHWLEPLVHAKSSSPALSSSDNSESQQLGSSSEPEKKIARQKPLKGGLNQLNSSQDKVRPQVFVKRSPPSNFAQAVATPTGFELREEEEQGLNLVLARGSVDHVISRSEAAINVEGYGRFTLHLDHLDLGPEENFHRLLQPGYTTISATLRPGLKPNARPELLRADIEDVEAGKQEKGLGSTPASNSWEELDDSAYEPLKIEDDTSHDADASEIDLDELDKYYDELHQIINYLETELPKVIPTIANNATCFQSLANKVLAAPRNAESESKVLENFLLYHSVPSRIKILFTSEYVKFRKFPTPHKIERVASNEKTAFEEAKDFFKDPIAINGDTKRTSPRGFGGAQPKVRAKPTTQETNESFAETKFPTKTQEGQAEGALEGKMRSRVKDFLTWLEGAVRSKEVFAQKHQLYSAILNRPTMLTRVWYEVTVDTQTNEDSFISFINVKRLGEGRLSHLQHWVETEALGGGDWATFVQWFEGDTNLFRVEDRVGNKSQKTNGFASLELSPLEKEFADFLDSAKETSSYSLRCLVLLRRADIRLSGLVSLHHRLVEEKAHPRELQQRLQSLLERRAGQRELDGTLQWVANEGGGKEHVPSSHRRIDKFLPLIMQSLTSYLMAKAGGRREVAGKEGKEETRLSKRQVGGNIRADERGRHHEIREEEQQRRKDPEPVQSEERQENPTREQEDNSTRPSSSSSSLGDLSSFGSWLELALASGRVSLPPSANVESVLWSLRARGTDLASLHAMWAGGAFGWQLRVSQLNLQPPIGVSVPEVADWLGSFFNSLDSVADSQEEEEEVVMEEDYNEEDDEDSFIGNEEEEDEVSFRMDNVWPGEEREMQKMFVFSEMGGMSRALLRSTWAAALNTTDQEKERILNLTFAHFERDQATQAMLLFIEPHVQTDGLRKAMKVLNQQFPERAVGGQVNDTDSEKQRRDLEEEEEEEEERQEEDEEEDTNEDDVDVDEEAVVGGGAGAIVAPGRELRNRLLSTDTIKDESLWEAESALAQLWEHEDRQDHEERAVRRPRPRRLEDLPVKLDAVEKKVEEVDSTLASWQPMVASGIGGNRELILQLNSRIEVLENQVTSLLNERARADGRRGGREEDGRGGREYVRIAREGAEDEVAEVPTNSEGLLPMQTVKALFDGTSAIKYRVEGRRTWRALLLEAELYHSPEDGWGERVYLCTAPQGTREPVASLDPISSFPMSSPWGLAPSPWGPAHHFNNGLGPDLGKFLPK